ncbi:hypothetical protein KKF84_15785, partial [Myxococcota bacterium]|nr:hypothetical protein [Myxococcota bacterium]
LASLERQLVEDIRPTLSRNKSLIDKMVPIEYEEAFYRYAWTIDQQTGVALKWGLLNKNAVRAAVANPLTKLAEKGVTQNAMLSIQRAVSQGLIRGSSYPSMMKGLKPAKIRKARVMCTYLMASPPAFS